MIDKSPQVNPGYAIRSSACVPAFEVIMTLALVTTRHDHSTNTALFPGEYERASSSGSIFGNMSCPTLKFNIMSSCFNEENRFMEYISAGGVVNQNTPPGMFAGNTQPIAWMLQIQNLDSPGWIEEYEIPAGEHENERLKKERWGDNEDDGESERDTASY